MLLRSQMRILKVHNIIISELQIKAARFHHPVTKMAKTKSLKTQETSENVQQEL